MWPSVENPAQVKSPFCPLRAGVGSPVSMSQIGIGNACSRPLYRLMAISLLESGEKAMTPLRPPYPGPPVKANSSSPASTSQTAAPPPPDPAPTRYLPLGEKYVGPPYVRG